MSKRKKPSPFSRKKKNSPANHLLPKAVSLHNLAKFEEAKKIYEQILKQTPNHPDTLHLLGKLLYDIDKPALALTFIEKAIAHSRKDEATYYNSLGISQFALDLKEEAFLSHSRAIQIDPNFAESYSNLGYTLHHKKEYQAAIDAYTKALELNPSMGGAYINLAETYRALGENDLAISNYSQGLPLAPGFPWAYLNLGATYMQKKESTKAIEAYKKAIQLDPELAFAYSNTGSALLAQGKIRESIDWDKKSFTIDDSNEIGRQNMLMALNYLTAITPQEVFSKHQDWGKRMSHHTNQLCPRQNTIPAPGNRIKIGYISPDFWRHAVANFIEPILTSHNHVDFEIICYSDISLPDDMTTLFQTHADGWRDIHDLNDTEVTNLIREDEIDILIDLAGHTSLNRLQVFARKPAPIQVTYLGYPNTTGLQTMDYRISDNYADPAGTSEHLYTEQLIRMSKSFLCYAFPPENLPINDPPAYKNGYVTFVSFNNRPKLNDEVISCWSQILKNVPNSKILLKSSPLVDANTREELIKKFTDQGIKKQRVVILDFAKTYLDHMVMYNLADIALDTFPYNGTTTTYEALWMGIPVVTVAGKTHVGRVGVSILSQIDMQELIADDQDDYKKRVISLANDLPKLTKIRSTLRDKFLCSASFNRKQFTLELEQLYKTMAGEWNKNHTQLEVTANSPSSRPFRGLSLSIDPCADALALNQRGEQLFADEKHDKAYEAFQQAVDLDNNCGIAYNNMGVLHWHGGKIKEAIDCFKKALSVNTPCVSAADNLQEIITEANTKKHSEMKASKISTRKLHIGGKAAKPGWEILNAVAAPEVDHLGNANDLSQFTNDTFSEIYSSHVVEHFDYKDDLLNTLKEWRRVLTPDGTLHVSVPDLDTLTELFLKKSELSFEQRFHIMRMMFGGHVDEYDYHLVGLNFDFLSYFLQEAGFTNIHRVKELGIFNDTSSMVFAGVSISLNVVAKNPSVPKEESHGAVNCLS